jgi:c-di-GMP-binding flagellar brake protein YcgR
MTLKDTTPNLVEDWSGVRRWTRYAIDVRVKVVSSRGGVRTTVYGRGTDVSEGGMSAYIALELNLNSSIEMEMTLPYAQQPLRVKARVRSRDGLRYGLEFLSLAPPEREVILRACKALALVQ